MKYPLFNLTSLEGLDISCDRKYLSDGEIAGMAQCRSNCPASWFSVGGFCNVYIYYVIICPIIFFLMVGFMVLNTTFNNISVISWLSVLLVEETGVPGENHRSVASHWQTLSHNVVLSTSHLSGVRTHNDSLHLNKIKFCLYMILFYSGFSLDRFHSMY